MEVRYFKDKGYAFVRFDNKESACNAIVALHLTEVGNQVIKCSWGKEGGGARDDSQYGGGGGGYNSNQGASQYHHHQQHQQHYGGKDKGYAFVRFDNKESACNAIVALHLTEVGNQV